MTQLRDEIGAHMSIAGGLHLALERGRELGCGAVQIFLKNQRQWAAKPLTPDETRTFTEARRATAIRHVFAHSSYLINLGNPDTSLWAQAVTAFTDELERAEALGLSCVVVHPGSTATRTSAAVSSGSLRSGSCSTIAASRRCPRFWRLPRSPRPLLISEISRCFEDCGVGSAASAGWAGGEARLRHPLARFAALSRCGRDSGVPLRLASPPAHPALAAGLGSRRRRSRSDQEVVATTSSPVFGERYSLLGFSVGVRQRWVVTPIRGHRVVTGQREQRGEIGAQTF